MKEFIPIILALIVLVSCNEPTNYNSQNSPDTKGTVNNKVQIYFYDSQSIPSVVSKLITNHLKDFVLLDSAVYKSFCRNNELKTLDSINVKNYYSIKILHDLFTCKEATNGSKGEILNMPYFWHWVKPNPRYTIYLAKNKKLLKDIKPPTEFLKFNSYAEIDRTPYLFISDLFQPELKYYSESCGSFSTFGWCSEREMAFVCLLDLLGYKGKIVAEGIHSWSEFLVPMTSENNILINFSVKVDNTFNNVDWGRFKDNDIGKWKEYLGNLPQAKWYNQQAHLNKEKERIKNFRVSTQAMTRIEKSVVKYLEKKINN